MENKNLEVLTSNTIRGVLRQANENNVTKENIVTISKWDNQYYLIYEK